MTRFFTGKRTYGEIQEQLNECGFITIGYDGRSKREDCERSDVYAQLKPSSTREGGIAISYSDTPMMVHYATLKDALSSVAFNIIFSNIDESQDNNF